MIKLDQNPHSATQRDSKPTHSTHAIVVGNGPSMLDYDWSSVEADIIATNRTWQAVPSTAIITNDENIHQELQNNRRLINLTQYVPSKHSSGYLAGLYAAEHYDYVWLVGFDGARTARLNDIGAGQQAKDQRVFKGRNMTANLKRQYGEELNDLIYSNWGRVRAVETREHELMLLKATGLKRK